MARRRTRWLDTKIDETTSDVGQDTASLLAGVNQDDTRGMTVGRIVGKLWMTSTTIGGAHGVASVDVGIGVVAQESFAAGVFPDPDNAIQLAS